MEGLYPKSLDLLLLYRNAPKAEKRRPDKIIYPKCCVDLLSNKCSSLWESHAEKIKYINQYCYNIGYSLIHQLYSYSKAVRFLCLIYFGSVTSSNLWTVTLCLEYRSFSVLSQHAAQTFPLNISHFLVLPCGVDFLIYDIAYNCIIMHWQIENILYVKQIQLCLNTNNSQLINY